LVCPLCGKLSSYRLFDPSGFEVDIRVKTMRGLGRGRGFAEEGSESILDDADTVAKVRNRLLSILSLLLRKGLVSEETVIGRLGLDVGGESEEDDSPYVARYERLEALAERLEEKMYGAMDLSTDEIDPDEDIASRLNRVARKLISDYLSLRDVTDA
jgi:hypothetical protein